MQLPAYWWLLALAVLPQGWFFVRYCLVRMVHPEDQPLTRPGAILLGLSGTAGAAYGVVQADPVFFLGQACLLGIYLYESRWQKQ